MAESAKFAVHDTPCEQDTSHGHTVPQSRWSFHSISPLPKNAPAEVSPPVPKATEAAIASESDATQTAPDGAEDEDEHAHAEHTESADAVPEPPNPRKYKVRTCRICFDEVPPTFEHLNATAILLGQKPRVVYISDDPECGRLMRPCQCKGTQQYVHEGCLNGWRMAQGADRNLWKCPTCLYEYRLNRLSWGRWISSTGVRVGITLLILLLSVFLLGFVADPILRYADPVALLSDYSLGPLDDYEEVDEWIPDDEDYNTWHWHFTRGFASLGVIGMFQSLFSMRPQIIRLGGGAMRRRGGGRERVENIQWGLVLIGVALFLHVSCAPADSDSLNEALTSQQTVWKAVSAYTARTLGRLSDTIVDVPGEDDEDEDEDTEPTSDQPQADAPPAPEARKDQ